MIKIPLREFISTAEEWHATVVGFCEMFPPWPSRYKLDYVTEEFHYYMFGRTVGFGVWILLLRAALKGSFN